jgi:hypothetical protein
MVWTSSVETALLPTNDSRVSPLRKVGKQNGRRKKVDRGALFFSHTFVLGTNAHFLF